MKDWPRIRKRKRGDWCIDCGLVEGKRRQFFRSDKTEAECLAAELREEREDLGTYAMTLTPRQRVDAAEAVRMLPKGLSLRQVVLDYLQRHQTVSRTIEGTLASLLKEMSDRSLRPRSIETAKQRLGAFSGDYGDRQIGRVTAEEVEAWLDHRGFKGGSRAAMLRYLRQLFSFAIRRGWAIENPAKAILMPKHDEKMPEFMAVEDVHKFFMDMAHRNRAALSGVAIGFFAGLRVSELAALRWRDVDYAGEMITVRPEVAKTRRARHVPMAENLVQWLACDVFFRSHRDPALAQQHILPRNFDRCRHKACEFLKIKWPHNCMRRSFATYHVAMHEDAAKTAYMLGHTNGVDVLYRHYRGLTDKASAEKYWCLMP